MEVKPKPKVSGKHQAAMGCLISPLKPVGMSLW